MEFLPVWPFPVNTLFFFGFLLFCGALGGYVAHRWPWIPSITGFMVVGLFAGPNVLGLISPEALAQSRIVVDVALALILYRLGLETRVCECYAVVRREFERLLSDHPLQDLSSELLEVSDPTVGS